MTPTTWNEDLNRRIESIREKRSIPRAVAARAAGIKADTYRARILEGRAFTLDQVAAICAAIDVNMIDLLAEIDAAMRDRTAAA